MYLIDKAKNVAKLTIDNGFKNSKDIDAFVNKELLSNAKFIAELAQISPYTNMFIKSVETGIDIGFAYWNGEINIETEENEIKIFDQAIKDIILKHPKMTLEHLNNTKNQIDKECNK